MVVRSCRRAAFAALALSQLMLAGCSEEPASAVAVPAEPAKVWSTKDLFASDAAWGEEYQALEAMIPKLATAKGTLGKDAATLLAFLDARSLVLKRGARLTIYANLISDENISNAANLERKQKAQTLLTKFNEATSWMQPEILALGAETIARFEAEAPKLKDVHGFMLADTLRAAPHTLSPDEENLIAMFGDVFAQPGNVYRILANSELPFPTVTLSDGKPVRLDQAAYSRLRALPDRADRKRVFDGFWSMWKSYQNTLGANLAAYVIRNVTMARARHFPNALSAALFGDNMPEAVYRQLVAQVNAGLPTLHRYLRLRKRLLGITDDMGYYDIYPPMFKNDKAFPLKESMDLTLAAVQPLGLEYVEALTNGFSAEWQHVFPQEGKASGAYMSGGAYDVHPYVLLNHNDDYDSLSTLAHEWGHAIHSVFSNKYQPFEKSDYSTFTAETAAITNEILLQDYLYKNATTREDKLFYLGEALETLRGTFFRQVMFAEFQANLHDAVEKGEQLSGEKMTAIYCDLLKRYHGEKEGVMKIDPTYCAEWTFVPHFYYGFYVYQYATSMTGAAYFAEQISQKGEPAAQNYLNLLKAGGSDFPYELYKRAGLDMASSEPYQALLRRMNTIMDEMEMLLAEQPSQPAEAPAPSGQ
ncbi:MAG: oligoendopeptidase F [Alphaproteobacteria bacterium]|nr:oligoendopeptidase F [Alphaproteobacteria bacterium]